MRVPKSVCLLVTNEVSASTFYRGYLSFLRERGWKVSVVASSNGTLHEFGLRENVEAYNLVMSRDPAPWQDLKSLINAVVLLSRMRPETVVAATPKAGLLGILAAWITRVPVRVYQLWGLRLETERGWRRVVLTISERIAAGLATQVVANSRSLACEAKTLGLARGKTIQVLGPGSSHGVDIEHFSTSILIDSVDQATMDFLNVDKDILTVGYVGRIHNDKGIDTLLDALVLCADAGLLLNVLIVGAYESPAMKKEIDRASLTTRIHVVGRVSDPRPYYKVMDFLCLPSRREGFPNVVLEAAAMSVPAIVSDATGVVDSVVDGVTGVVFSTNSGIELFHSIWEIANDRSKRQLLGTNSLAHVRTHFNSQQIWSLQEQNLNRQRIIENL